MVHAKFTPTFSNVTTKAVTQWDYGRKLRIEGLELPTAVRIDFGVSGGQTTVGRIGLTKDRVTDVVIPDSLLEQSNNIVAYVYVSDTEEGKTVRTINIPVNARAKPEEYDSPESKELFAEAIEMVNAAAGRAENAETSAKSHADSAKESLEATEQIAGSFTDTATAAVNAVNSAGAAQVQAIGKKGAEAVSDVETAKEESIAAVQAEGASQLDQIQVAGANIVNAAANAEQNAKNVLANAIKGHLKGEVVAADDVSCVGHEMTVKVCGKNHFDVSKVESSDKITNNGDGSVTIAAGAYGTSTEKTLCELCPTLEEGKKYVLTLTTQSALAKYIYLTKSAITWVNGRSLTVTREMLDSYVMVYGMHSAEEAFGQECDVSNIQIEEGEAPTEYAPHVAPEMVKVRRCGRNILAFKDSFSMTQGSVVLEYDKDTEEFTLNGNGTKEAPVNFQMGILMAFKPYIGESVNMTVSVVHSGGSMVSEKEDVEVWWYVTYLNIGSSALKLKNQTETKTFSLPAGQFGSVWLYVNDTVTFTDYKFKVQIEVAEKATDFETHNYEEYTPATDGTVSGMTSLSPNMTIMTDTDGAIVECEYNIDTKTYIDNKIKEMMEGVTK